MLESWRIRKNVKGVIMAIVNDKINGTAFGDAGNGQGSAKEFSGVAILSGSVGGSNGPNDNYKFTAAQTGLAYFELRPVKEGKVDLQLMPRQ